MWGLSYYGKQSVFSQRGKYPQNQDRHRTSKVYGRIVSQKLVRNSVVVMVLKNAWSRFGPVRMTDINDKTMVFEFDSDRDREQILNQAPWSLHVHCLNLKTCSSDSCMEELNFNLMHIWIQVYGLSLDMYNQENAVKIGDNMGMCISTEPNHIMKQRSFLRFKMKIDITAPRMADFWWANEKGEDKWAMVRYERLSEHHNIARGIW